MFGVDMLVAGYEGVCLDMGYHILVSARHVVITMVIFLVCMFAGVSSAFAVQTSTGETDLVMQLAAGDNEYGSSNDNLAFTVPSVINFTVKADGSLIGPSSSATYIENDSVFPTCVSAMQVAAKSGFSFVASGNAGTTSNAVVLNIGPSGHLVSAHNFASKASLTPQASWVMAASSSSGVNDRVQLSTSGSIANITADLTSATSFGTIHWYLKAGS